MHPETIFGLDPLGLNVAVLCTIVGLALAGLIIGGFALLRRAEHARGVTSLGKGSAAVPELGVLALWRLNRALRQSTRIRGNAAGSVATAVYLAGDRR